jgi:hypothetical protein
MQTKTSLLKLAVTCVALIGLATATANAQLVFDADTGVGVTTAPNVDSWTAVGGGTILTPTGTSPTVATEGVGPGAFNYISFTGDPLANTSVPASIVGGSESAVVMVLRNAAQDRSVVTWIQQGLGGTEFNRLLQVSDSGPSIFYVQGDVDTTPALRELAFATTPPEWNDGAFHVLSMVRNGTAAEFRLDGTPIALAGNAFPTGPSWDTTGTGTLTVGGAPFDAAPSTPDLWTGDLAEIQIYNAVPGDINAVELALGTEYGLTVVPEPSEYAMIFGLACVAGAVALRYRRQQLAS